MRVLLLHLDGKLPNIALMRVAAHHRALGDEVELRHVPTVSAVGRTLDDLIHEKHGAVYASLIFERTRPVAERVLKVYPGAIVGGTGFDVSGTLEQRGITTLKQDYSIYQPKWTQSIGFTQRGCRLKCSFCVVPKKEGGARDEQSVADIWRGDPYPRHLILLDNDFFGAPSWRQRIAEIRDGEFKVCFSQGINVRAVDDEAADAIASVDYRDDMMRERRIFTAWDNRRDEKKLFAGLEKLTARGVKPRHIMVYMLIGYWPGETTEDREHRRARLREFGCLPYPMPFVRTPELVAFQRWVISRNDKSVPWADWLAAKAQPRNLKRPGPRRLSLFDLVDDE